MAPSSFVALAELGSAFLPGRGHRAQQGRKAWRPAAADHVVTRCLCCFARTWAAASCPSRPSVPVKSLPNLRYAWAYVRGRGMVNLDGQRQVPAKVMLRHSCDATAVRDFVAAIQACVAEGASAGRESLGRGDGYRPGMFAVLRNQPRPWSPACRDLGAVV